MALAMQAPKETTDERLSGPCPMTVDLRLTAPRFAAGRIRALSKRTNRNPLYSAGPQGLQWLIGNGV